MPESSPFEAFAETAADVAALAGRNDKADRLGRYFQALDEADLARAARYAAGRLFPLHDQRTANAGTAALLKATAAAAGVDVDTLRPRLVALGDAGDVAFEALGGRAGGRRSDAFSLADAEGFFALLAGTRGANATTDLVADRLARLSPRAAQYLVKLLAGDPRIGLRAGGVEGALARTFGRPVRAVQRANMLLGDIGRTAVLARDGCLGEATFAPLHPLMAMLASPAEDAAEVAARMPGGFAVEDKFDGIRAQAHVFPATDDDTVHGMTHGAARVALFSRTLDAITYPFPELVPPLAALLDAAPGGLVLDGEIVPVRGGAIEPFQALQPRLGRKRVTEAMRADQPVAFLTFDVLVADGQVLLDEPLRARRAALEALPLAAETDDAPLRRSALTWTDDAGTLDERFDAARARGNEGLMVKAPGSAYVPGRRGKDWLKLKRALATLDCVVTAVEVGNGRRREWLSDYTFAVRASEDDPTLLNVGKAYSGLTDAEIAEMTAWFTAHTRETFAHGKVRTVEPEVVVEVAFDRVQPSKRHRSGYALRFPRIVRLRPDKPASEIDTLDAVRRLAEP